MKPQNVHAQEDRLLDFAYGELPASEAQVVESHLQGCPRCTEALNEIRGVRVTMAQLSAEPAPDAGLESLLAYAQQSARRTAAGPAPQPSRWRRWLLPVVGLASAGTLSVLTFMAVSPELTRPQLSTVDAQMKAEVSAAKQEARLPAAPPMGGAPAAAAPMAVAPPALPGPGYELADARQADGDKGLEYSAKRKDAFGGAEAERAEGWAEAGSGGGVGTRRPIEAPKPQAPSIQKVSREKAPSRVALNQEEAPPLMNAPAAAQAVAPASPPREPLRLGGGGGTKESLPQGDSLGGPAKSWDDAPGAPALESVTEPLARNEVASAPAPEMPKGSRGSAVGALAEAAEAKQVPLPRESTRSASLKKAKREPGLEARAASAAESKQEADDQLAPKRSVGELSRLALDANRSGDRLQEVSLLRLALEAGASGAVRMDLLSRVCDAELALGRRGAGIAACQQVLKESPESQAAHVARRRLSRESVTTDDAAPADSKPAP